MGICVDRKHAQHQTRLTRAVEVIEEGDGHTSHVRFEGHLLEAPHSRPSGSWEEQ